MVRYVWIGTMLAILCIVLYIPSASPPERFTEVLRAEHAASREIWGPAVADRILRRMLDIQQGSPPLSEPPAPMVHVGQQPAVDAAMAAQMTQMSMRLFGNPYFRSIDSLFALAAYRLSAIIELLPLLTIYLLVVAVDGFVLRQVRAKEFVAHSAEMFGGQPHRGDRARRHGGGLCFPADAPAPDVLHAKPTGDALRAQPRDRELSRDPMSHCRRSASTCHRQQRSVSCRSPSRTW
jgi:hypothetical protein